MKPSLSAKTMGVYRANAGLGTRSERGLRARYNLLTWPYMHDVSVRQAPAFNFALHGAVVNQGALGGTPRRDP